MCLFVGYLELQRCCVQWTTLYGVHVLVCYSTYLVFSTIEIIINLYSSVDSIRLISNRGFSTTKPTNVFNYTVFEPISMTFKINILRATSFHILCVLQTNLAIHRENYVLSFTVTASLRIGYYDDALVKSMKY